MQDIIVEESQRAQSQHQIKNLSFKQYMIQIKHKKKENSRLKLFQQYT